MKNKFTLIWAIALVCSHVFAQTEPEHYYINNDDPKGWGEKLEALQHGQEFDAAQHFPYPVIFIHGLGGSRDTWADMWNSLTSYGWTYGWELDYCLNDDNDLTYSNITSVQTSDISQFVTSSTLVPADFYIINFDVDADGTSHGDATSNSVQSNQAASVKQGVALSHAIKSVLSLTGKNKVILFGHSMGGLCARTYLQTPGIWASPNTDHCVAKLITTGTPHGGSNFTGAGLGTLFGGSSERSDAVRDLRTSYFISGDAGVLLFGGQESFDVMNNSAIWDYHSADVNCNGLLGNTFIGLNQRNIPTNLDCSCIVGIYGILGDDGVVDTDKADLKNYRAVQRELFISPKFHTSLPGDIQSNFLALDEPDDYALAYEIDRNTTYTGYFTVQGEDSHYAVDYDDYRFTMPQAGFVKGIAGNLPSTNTEIYFVRASDEEIVEGVQSNGASQLSTNLTWLPAGDYYFEIVTTPQAALWDNTHWLRVEYNGGPSSTIEQIPGVSVAVSPNPTTGPLNITITSELPVAGEFSILDYTGRNLYTQKIESVGSYEVSLDREPAGLYFVMLRTAEGVGAWSVVKE